MKGQRTNRLLLLAVVAATVIGAALLAAPSSPLQRVPTLGLDLRGGLEVVLKAHPTSGKLTPDELARSRDIMAERVNKLGVAEPDVRTQPPDEIVIELAGIHDAAAAARIIGQTAQLQFFDFEADVVGPSKGADGQIAAGTSLYALLSQVQGSAQAGHAQAYYRFEPRRGKEVLAGSARSRAGLGRPQPGEKILALPRGILPVSCAATTGCLGATSQAPTYWYLLAYHPGSAAGPPELTGNDLVLSGTRADFDQQGRPQVDLSFTGRGATRFQQITKEEWQAGRVAAGLAGHAGDRTYVSVYARHFAIVLDGQIRSTPLLDYTDPSLEDGIAGGGAVIDNVGSVSEAKQLALVLQTGALPVKFDQIERTEVSATLGKSSLREAWIAAAVGLAVVAAFLLVVYRFLGFVAVVGLTIYVAVYYAAIVLFNVTLSLPGFAGAILTIGVAADANVVVFERIKEEVRAGRSVRAAIAAGYDKGFHTIIDANVVTAITALVLFAVATAQVKGFALMLLIGTVISLLTAVAATRALLGLLGGFSWFDNPVFMGASGTQRAKWLQIDFVGKRRIWFGISAAALLIGAVSMGTRGLNLGIDFRGGTQMAFQTASAQPLGVVQSIFSRHGLGDAVVQGRGQQRADGFTQFQIRTRHLTNAQEAVITRDLRHQAELRGQPNVNTVSASFGGQIAHDAILAILVSLALIVAYLSLRFGPRFALPVIVALLHDIAVTVGIYSISGREVSTATVAAILTVLGYSIYDTIIVFDRIRENVPLMRRRPFAVVANVSLWETIRRSLATSFITLLPIVALYLFGGPTLRDFAFALVVGVTSGAYSSIFIATPLLAMRQGPKGRPVTGPDSSPVARGDRQPEHRGR
jgi:SecD/SecF fusion protein